MPYARRREAITAALAGLLIVSACKHDRAARTGLALPPARAPAPTPRDAAVSETRVTIEVAKPRTTGTGFAKRCVLGGDPLPAS